MHGADGGVRFRSAEEYAAGHAPGALNVPFMFKAEQGSCSPSGRGKISQSRWPGKYFHQALLALKFLDLCKLCFTTAQLICL